jgi:hypothetical protein
MLIALFVQWVAYSQREARREDRRLDRLERLQQRAAVTSVASGDEEVGAGYDQARSGQATQTNMGAAGSGRLTGDGQ